MVESFTHALHGVSLIPELTKEFTGDDFGMHFRRTGDGTVISQNPGTHNWFHFPIHTPLWLDGDPAQINTISVILEANENVNIDVCRIHEVQKGRGVGLLSSDIPPDSPILIRSDSEDPDERALFDGLPFSDRRGGFVVDLKRRRTEGAIVLSMHAVFNGDDTSLGEMKVFGAEVRVFER